MNNLNFSNSPSFALDNFEGTLELLLYLIQKEEVDVCDVAIQELTKQLTEMIKESAIETNAELMGLAATLLLMKSQKLLPNERVESGEIEEDPRVEIIEKLIEYCRFRDAASSLLTREEEQKAFFPRATFTMRKELGAGLEEVELHDLKEVMLEMLKRAEKKQPLIRGEEWLVAPKIAWLREELKKEIRLSFEELFSEDKSRGELIVSFLALLEMMKFQELKIVRENNLMYIIVNHEHKPS